MKIYIDLKKFRTVPNEKNDCGVTSLAIATGMGYTKAWQTLRSLGRDKGTGTLGFKANELQLRGGLTLAKFIKLHNRGRFIVYTKDHAVAVVDGKVFDSNMTHGKTHIRGFITLEG
jgi:hypothetical protein